MPCTLPLGDVAGVFMSPCASTQSRPIGSLPLLPRPSRPPRPPSRPPGCDRRRARSAARRPRATASAVCRASGRPRAISRMYFFALVAAVRASRESARAGRPCRRRCSRARRGARRGRRCGTPTVPCPRRGGRRRDRAERRSGERRMVVASSDACSVTDMPSPDGETIVVSTAGFGLDGGRGSRVISLPLVDDVVGRGRGRRGRDAGSTRSKKRL